MIMRSKTTQSGCIAIQTHYKWVLQLHCLAQIFGVDAKWFTRFPGDKPRLLKLTFAFQLEWKLRYRNTSKTVKF